ncbi:hypothetical protein J1P26_12630 [Neobacillus sp. MM2021_6]|nr:MULTISPECIES: hypothetical protein [Bacillaceae]MBO0960542.1 hypothetical protein [Neobacillus sp. MM2021_6]NHC19248.1 hypothetical protein [Bacillus sp. MM2020_4]
MSKKNGLSIGVADFLLVLGAGAIVCGILFILKPDGSLLKMSVDLLENSPFKNFFIPGIMLLVFNGVFSLIAAFLLLIHYRYAGIGVMFLGGVMMIWIVAQVFWLGWISWLQPTFLALGVFELIVGLYLDSQNNIGLFSGRHHGSHAH